MAAIAALVVFAPAADARGPSTAEERSRAVETTRRLEKQPLSRRSDEARRWLFKWIVEIPDINVTGCSGPLDALMKDEESPYANRLYVQSIFGMAAFLIENPKKARDWAAVQTAGIESVLRAYESILSADPEERFEVLDRLLEARKAGRLRKLVEEEMADCGKPRDEMGPAPRDAI
jgi:hypothetical protein